MTEQGPELPPGGCRVHLLEPDGTPTGENWWDRRLRLDSRWDYVPGAGIAGRSQGRLLVNLHGGYPGTWQRLYEHLADPRPDWPYLSVHPVAFEAYVDVSGRQELPWLHVLLPRVEVFDTPTRPPEDGWPVWTWVSRANIHWPGDPVAATSPVVWRCTADLPGEVRAGLGLAGEDQDLAQVVVGRGVELPAAGDQP